MAYQNVGTPRFYISYGDWFKSMGDEIPRYQTISPYETGSIEFTYGDDWYFYPPPGYPSSSSSLVGCNWFGALNHDRGTVTSVSTGSPVISDYYDYTCLFKQTPYPYSTLPTPEAGHNVTYVTDINMRNLQHKGFSLATFSPAFTDLNTTIAVYTGVGLTSQTGQFNNYAHGHLNIACWVYGATYDVPHSPDLELTMTREIDGVKRIRTKGGADLVDHKYTKPAMWGDAGAWELYSGNPTNQDLSRSGRRAWDLSFSYLQDSDLFPVSELNSDGFGIYSSGSILTDPGEYEQYVDYSVLSGGESVTAQDLMGGNSFYNQVIHKTNGGQLPFIFQPDKNNNNSDSFAICKFDMDSFEFDQVANGVYNIKLKIREVW